MVRIDRHQIGDIESLLEMGLEDGIKEMPRRIAQASTTWRYASGCQATMLEVIRYGSLLSGPNADVLRAICVASDCGVCLFNCGAGLAPTKIAGKNAEFDSVEDNSILNASEWIRSFYLALIGRQDLNCTALSRIPVATIRQSITRESAFRYTWIETLQAMQAGRPDLGNLLIRAMEETDPNMAIDPDWVLHHDVHEMNVLTKLLARDAKAFEAALVKAIVVHKDYWSKTEDRRADTLGFMSIPLTALAALAYDSGYRFDIDSEYLPMWLVTGERAV